MINTIKARQSTMCIGRLLWADFVMGRVCNWPRLLWAEMSSFIGYLVTTIEFCMFLATLASVQKTAISGLL